MSRVFVNYNKFFLVYKKQRSISALFTVFPMLQVQFLSRHNSCNLGKLDEEALARGTADKWIIRGPSSSYSGLFFCLFWHWKSYFLELPFLHLLTRYCSKVYFRTILLYKGTLFLSTIILHNNLGGGS